VYSLRCEPSDLSPFFHPTMGRVPG
jgi:hypothetical protein